MDSLTQVVLGASVAVAAMGRRTAAWKAALWGGVAGTLPDLDALIDHGDAVLNMVRHRAESHALLYLLLAAGPLGWLIARIHGEMPLWRRWWWTMTLVLLTHPLLDAMTVYGTQLLLPFTDRPYGVGSIFIIDPLYTLPLLAGVGLALARRAHGGLGANRLGLWLSTAYLAWSALAQGHVQGLVQSQLAAQGRTAQRVLVTPAPLNTLLWRVVVMREDGFDEGFVSLLDRGRPIRFDRFASDPALEAAVRGLEPVQRIARFSQGFYKVHEADGVARITDLRMGQEPAYAFSFAAARREGERWVPLRPENLGGRMDVKRGLAWLGPRMLGEDLPPPR